MARRLASRCACDPTRAAGEGTRLAMSALRLDLALVPASEGEAREALQQDEDEHAGGGDEEHRREHARDLKLIARLENPEGEPRLGAARARYEFGNHSADEGETAADAQAAEEKWQGRRKAQIAERLPTRGAVEAKKIDEVPVRAREPQHGVGEDREEGDEPRADQQSEGDPLDPEDDEGSDGHQRCHLENDRVGKERALDPRRLREDHGEDEAQHRGDEKSLTRDG